MPFDWDKFYDEDLGAIADDAEAATDEALASRVSSLTVMKDEEIIALFPVEGDVKKFGELMQIVKSAEERNKKIQNIVSGAEKFGGVVLTLLDRLV